MKKMFKTLGVLLVLALTFVTLGSLVSAEDFQVDYIKVNGLQMYDESEHNGTFDYFSPVYVERGGQVVVEVFLRGLDVKEQRTLDGAYDTRIRAWIGGYEYDEIADATEIFQVLPGIRDRKVLVLELPEDLESSETYTLNVDIYDDDQMSHNEYTLRVEETRHLINIYDAAFNPGRMIKAGQPLFLSVRLENMGDNSEDNIKVIAKIPALGVQAEEYVDELLTWNDENAHEADEDDAVSTSDLLLMIPANAAAGEYNLDVVAQYDRGHKEAKKSFTISVVGGAAVVTPGVTTDATMVNAVTTSQAVQAGEGAVYKLSVANLGTGSVAYTFAVRGTEGWGTYSVDPATLNVAAGANGEVNVYVSPSADATDGVKSFAVDVMANGKAVKSVALTLDVEGQEGTSATTVLLIIFLVLLAILVILGIVLVIRKLAGSREDNESIEGQTYY